MTQILGAMLRSRFRLADLRADWMYWVLAIALGATAIVLPRALVLNVATLGGMLTDQAYATMLGIAVGALIMALRDPAYDRRWAKVVGLAPLAEMAVRMFESGPGNLWPIAIFLALMMGFPPAFIGLYVARGIRLRMQPKYRKG